MTKWVRYPGPGQFRGEGTWRTIADLKLTEGEWDELAESGFLPTHEGPEPPESPEDA